MISGSLKKSSLCSSSGDFPALRPYADDQLVAKQINLQLWLLRSCRIFRIQRKIKEGSRGFVFAKWGRYETVQKEEIQRVVQSERRILIKGILVACSWLGTYHMGGHHYGLIAAVHSGAGLVTVTTDPDNLTALRSHLPEAMGFGLGSRTALSAKKLAWF